MALSALSSGVGAGLGAAGPLSRIAGWGGAAARAAAGSVITQGVAVATGLQDSFSWTDVAVGAVTSGVGQAVGAALPNPYAAAFTSDGIRNGLISGTASALAGAATRSALTGTSFGDNLIAVLPQVIGSTIGNAVAGGIAAAQKAAGERRQDRAYVAGNRALIEEFRGAEFSPQAGADYEADLFDDLQVSRALNDRGQFEAAGDRASRASDRLRAALSETAQGRARLAETDTLFGPPEGYVPIAERRVGDSAAIDLGDGQTITGVRREHARVISKFADNLTIDAGSLIKNVGAEVGRRIDEIPGAALAVRVLDFGLMFAGGPIRAAASAVYEQGRERLVGGATELYTDAGYRTDAEPGGLGLIALPEFALGGLTGLLGAARSIGGGGRGPDMTLDRLTGRHRASGVLGSGQYISRRETMSPAAAVYQEFATGTPSGQVFLYKGVNFDGVQNNTLLDAKGRYAQFVDRDGNFHDWARAPDKLEAQARLQLEAADGVPIEWRFQELRAAEATTRLLQSRNITGITVRHYPTEE